MLVSYMETDSNIVQKSLQYNTSHRAGFEMHIVVPRPEQHHPDLSKVVNVGDHPPAGRVGEAYDLVVRVGPKAVL